MPHERFAFTISARKLLVGLLVTVVPLSLFALYTVNRAAGDAERKIGGHFKTIAASTADAISDFIHGTVVEVTSMAGNPAVLDVVEAANRSYQGMSDSAIIARMQRGDAIWNKDEGEPLVDRVLSNPASRGLRHYLLRDPKFLRITVIDEQGATVAATHKTFDYFQGDEEDWRSIYAEGRGVVSILDIEVGRVQQPLRLSNYPGFEYDIVAETEFIGIGIPILEEGSTRSIGALHVMINIARTTPLLGRADIGTSGSVFLVRGDGRIIRSPNSAFSANINSDEYAAVLDSLGTLQSRQTGYIVSEVRNQGETLIGFTDTGLKEDYPNLSWAVLVSQPTAEAFAFIRTPALITFFMAFLGLGAVVFIAVYFSQRTPSETGQQFDAYTYGP